MASEFEYLGCFNNTHEVKEIATGITWRLATGDASPDDVVTLHDGDLAVVENRRGELMRYSIREQRSLGRE